MIEVYSYFVIKFFLGKEIFKMPRPWQRSDTEKEEEGIGERRVKVMEMRQE